jgi:Ca-activated chloride channel family protein
MTFLAGARLWLLVLVAGLVAAYAVLQARRPPYAARFANLDLLASVVPARPGWRRHLPAAALALALAALVVGVARPARAVKIPREEATVVLALDVSVSMEATDVAPSRMAAARAAAREFVDDLPAAIRVGLVVFAGSARVVVPPTADRVPVDAALTQLRLAPRTAIGEAIFTALDSVAAATTADDVPARIVLLSDGATTAGRPNALAAQAAAEASVPVSTIAFGTDDGTVEVEGRTVPVPVDAPALQEVADATGGTFFEAASGDALRGVYRDIGSAVGFTTEHREVSWWFAGLGLGLAFAAAVAALAWMNRIV